MKTLFNWSSSPLINISFVFEFKFIEFNDVNLIKYTGIGVSYKGKQILNNVADVVFNHTNLKGLLYLQDYQI